MPHIQPPLPAKSGCCPPVASDEDLDVLATGGPEDDFDASADVDALSADSLPPEECPSVYQRLVEEGLLRKLTDIVMAKVSIPWHLRADAVQEVHVAWALLKAKPNFQRNQLARYAYMSGQHAALKLRRTIGAVVSIPGALFRTGRDSAFMESIGAVVNPKDVDDYADSLELSVEPDDYLAVAGVSDVFLNSRFEGLALSNKQRKVAHLVLVARMSVDDVALKLNTPATQVERLLNQVTNKLLKRDAECEQAATARGPVGRHARVAADRPRASARRGRARHSEA